MVNRGKNSGNRGNKWKRRAVEAEIRAKVAEEANIRLIDQISRLTDALAAQPAGILENLTPLFLGYREETAKVENQARLAQMMAGSYDEEEQRGIWFPDIEFDESMESREKWPGPLTISGQPMGGTGQTHHLIENGGVTRTDGQPMFRAGTTAPPPESGVE